MDFHRLMFPLLFLISLLSFSLIFFSLYARRRRLRHRHSPPLITDIVRAINSDNHITTIQNVKSDASNPNSSLLLEIWPPLLKDNQTIEKDKSMTAGEEECEKKRKKKKRGKKKRSDCDDSLKKQVVKMEEMVDGIGKKKQNQDLVCLYPFTSSSSATQRRIKLQYDQLVKSHESNGLTLRQINTCNGFYCDYFTPNKYFKPKMWTEAWSGWFTEFGGAVPYRPAEDLAYSVAKFIQTGGSFINYYMYHGGTNFGRTAGGPFIATSYDYDAPLDEFGLKREAKWGHLKDLHRAIKLCEPVLVNGDPSVISLGNYQKAYVFKNKTGGCAAFLANDDKSAFAKVNFQSQRYNLPPWSISILPDCKNTVYNTARVGAQTTLMKMTSEPTGFAWQSYNDQTEYYDDDMFGTVGLLEQLNVTRDASDYLWYMTDVIIDSNERFLIRGEQLTLTAFSAGHSLHVFINGELSGTVYGSLENPKITFKNGVNLRAGLNKISLLSIAVGLPNIGPHFETWNAGVLGPVTLSGLNEGRRDLSWQKWSYKVGLKGEILSLHSLSGSSSVEWVQGSYVAQKQPLTWYKAIFDAPAGDEPLALDMNSMGKGQVWVNGESIGRYWPAYKATVGVCTTCNYTGYYDEKKCLSNCGQASQRWYHLPRSWLKPRGNLLVVFEELGGIPYGISLVKREIFSVCADIYEWQPSLRIYQMQASGQATKPLRPKAHLSCNTNQKISAVKFASFGTPQGGCGSFQEGGCHARDSYDIFNKICVGQQSCAIPVNPDIFGGDPCPGVMKKLSVEVICS